MAHRVSATLVVLAATALALALTVGTGVAPWRSVPWLGRYGGPVHAVVLGWLIAAPALLLGAAAARRRTPWVWVVAVAVELLAVVVVGARYSRIVPDAAWPALAAVVAAGLASVVTAFPAPAHHRGSGPGDHRESWSR